MENTTYSDAMARLEEIMGKIQGGRVDIDQLAGLLKEAQELVKFCREKLYKVDEEIKALTEAETMLKTISDAKSAKAVKTKLMHKFSLLRPIQGGTEAQLLELARAQNRVSAVMWDLKKEPYFESGGLQELWTVMTHHYARRSAGAR
jgi:exodeoxyribonuclease VII small subunit